MHVLKLIYLSLFSLLCLTAQAGNQIYEPMSDAVKLVLKNSINDSADDINLDVPGDSFYERAVWLSNRNEVLKKFIKKEDDRIKFLLMVRYEALRAGLSPDLVLAVIHVESGFKSSAISSAGARGLMQVMPFWTQIIGDSDSKKLFHVRTNLRYGCTILRHYLALEKGDLVGALARYNGSVGRAEYPRLVFGALKHWQ